VDPVVSTKETASYQISIYYTSSSYIHTFLSIFRLSLALAAARDFVVVVVVVFMIIIIVVVVVVVIIIIIIIIN
jgi:hypothetical protein